MSLKCMKFFLRQIWDATTGKVKIFDIYSDTNSDIYSDYYSETLILMALNMPYLIPLVGCKNIRYLVDFVTLLTAQAIASYGRSIEEQIRAVFCP